MWQLTAKHGRRKGRSWPVDSDKLTIGRHPECTIRLNDPLVSREHCQVMAVHDQLVLEDLRSANSTLVNGSPVTRCTLRLGDELVVGEATFVVTQTSPFDSGTGTPIGLNTTQALPGGLSAGWAGLDWGGESLTVSELALLHRFASGAATCESAAEVFDQLVQCIYDHCSPIDFFLCTANEDEGPFVHPAGVVLDESVRGVLDTHMKKRIDHPAFFRRSIADEGDAFTTFIPLWVGGRFVGILGGDQRIASPQSAEPNLNFAVNVSRVLAPFLLAFSGSLSSGPSAKPGEAAVSFLGSSAAAEDARRLIAIAASADVPILIQGETGTGKELAASLIHTLSSREQGPFVAANCAAIMEDLFESEVFGHVKGAFTGAISSRKGLLAEANGGHLFLDEIADLSPRNQARLLRAIETQRYRPVGASEDSESDFRLVSASNRDLWEEVEAGRFRADLYYRLAAIELFLPPLSERRSDIPELAEHFAEEFARDRGVKPTVFDKSAMEYLTGQPWHGNVRELRNSVNKLSTFAPEQTLSKGEVEGILARRIRTAGHQVQQIRDIEREHIERVVADCGGRIQDAAKVLGIHRNTLSKKLKRYDHSN